jgi:ligand-binding sensor domain-containing protein
VLFAGKKMPDSPGQIWEMNVDGPRVWAGTEDGLVLIENGKVAKVYKPADGLVHRAVMGIAVDQSTGDLWLATFGGASHLSGSRFENFTNLTSGLLNDICYGIAVVDRYVWVATTAGVSRYNTKAENGAVGVRRTRPSMSPGPERIRGSACSITRPSPGSRTGPTRGPVRERSKLPGRTARKKSFQPPRLSRTITS